MNPRSIDYEDYIPTSKGMQHILNRNEGYDVRKIKGIPEYVVFFADEEVGHLDAWGKKTLVTFWGPELEKGYSKSPETAVISVIQRHKERLMESSEEQEYEPMAMSM